MNYILKLNDFFYSLVKNNELKDTNILKRWQDNSKIYYYFPQLSANININDLFSKYNIIQINETSLGRGEYCVTFEVIYKGTHAVAKVTPSMEDSFNLIELNKIKQTDPRISENLLKVYDVIYDFEKQIYIIIVEYLIPTHKGLVSDLWSKHVLPQYDKEQSQIAIENIQDFVKIYLENYFKEILPWETINDFINSVKFKNLCQEIHENVRDNNYIINDYNKLIETFKSSFVMFFNNETLQYEKAHWDPKQFIYEFVNTIYNTFVHKDAFPMRHENKTQTLIGLKHPDPRVKKLITTLLILKDEYNIDWYDLHEDNIMMRPKTNELVISDPGLFQFV